MHLFRHCQIFRVTASNQRIAFFFEAFIVHFAPLRLHDHLIGGRRGAEGYVILRFVVEVEAGRGTIEALKFEVSESSSFRIVLVVLIVAWEALRNHVRSEQCAEGGEASDYDG